MPSRTGMSDSVFELTRAAIPVGTLCDVRSSSREEFAASPGRSCQGSSCATATGLFTINLTGAHGQSDQATSQGLGGLF